jgi:hypothetical protein
VEYLLVFPDLLGRYHIRLLGLRAARQIQVIIAGSGDPAGAAWDHYFSGKA